MKLNEIINEDGKIVPGVNTTIDVKPGETERQAKKFFGGDGKPKHLGVPGATPNQAFNLGMVSENMSHTAKRIHDIERKKKIKPGTDEWFKLWFSLPYLKESVELVEGYKLKLERDDDIYILHIIDTESGKRTEVRGKGGYESGNYDPKDPLHQLLDKIGKASNISDLINGEPVGINPKHPDGDSAKAATDKAFNEDVSIPENIFHMKNRLLKVKKITDAMGNRPIMFRSFVYDAEPVAKIIKKVTNDSARHIKTGSNQKQNEVLQKLGIKNPTFAAMANSKYANVRRDSLEDMEVSGMQNIFIPMSNEVYYSDAIEDLGMGRKTGGRNIAVQSDFDVDAAVATYKKGWPSAGFDNEIIVDTEEYYLLNLRSFLLELTGPEIKDRIKRLKAMYDKSYNRRAEENHINDILKDIFKTKITTYSDISRWIENTAVPFVDMLAANRGEPTQYTYTDYNDDDDDWLDLLDDPKMFENEPGSLAHKINWGGQNKQPKPKQPRQSNQQQSWWQSLKQRVMGENFADGKKKGKSRPGRVKRAGASCNGSVTELRRKAKNSSGEKQKMYHWCANMKSGKKK